jgi:hypothetical protein
MRKNKIISILVIFIFAMSSGCALIGKKQPYKTLAITKITAEEIVSAAKKFRASGDLSEENFRKVRDIYVKARKANDALIDAMILSLDLGIVPESNPDYQEALKTYTKLARDLWELAVEFKLISN